MKIKSYTKIWDIQGTLFSVGDVNLPCPLTYMQIITFVIVFLLMLFLDDLPPFSMFNSVLLNNIAIPAALTFVISKAEFGGKTPIKFFLSYIMYAFRPHLSFCDKRIISKRKFKIAEKLTIVRSDFSLGLPDKIH